MTKKEREYVLIELEAHRFRLLFSDLVDYLDNNSMHLTPHFLSNYIKGRAIHLGLFSIKGKYGINPELSYIRECKTNIKELEEKLIQKKTIDHGKSDAITKAGANSI